MPPTLLQIILLGIVQGAAELLPVSSSAHVIAAERLMRLDPSSPEIVAYGAPNRTPGDLNFQYSGAHPYLYFTLLHPWENAPHRTDRDVVRQALTVRLGNWGK